MNAVDGGRQTEGEGHCPRQIADLAVVVADHEAADSSDGMPHGKRWRGSSESGHQRQSFQSNYEQTRGKPEREAAEPTQSTS